MLQRWRASSATVSPPPHWTFTHTPSTRTKRPPAPTCKRCWKYEQVTPHSSHSIYISHCAARHFPVQVPLSAAFQLPLFSLHSRLRSTSAALVRLQRASAAALSPSVTACSSSSIRDASCLSFSAIAALEIGSL